MIGHLRGTCKYYTGYPKDLGPSWVIHFTSECKFVNLLHEGFPVVVAFTIRYYTGYPKDLGPSRVIHFTSEFEFVNLLHEGFPVVVAFTIRSNYTEHLDKVLEEAAAEFYPHVKFMRVECPKYPGFCISRQKTEYPFIEIFHSPSHVCCSLLFTSVFNFTAKIVHGRKGNCNKLGKL